ncbi:MAG TPA: MFS transporter, partial [Candidatus Acidoferrales bacterium]|nr:MFS transporter [Candidatus Acidoferrales bacterium]
MTVPDNTPSSSSAASLAVSKVDANADASSGAIGGFRWVICGLLLFGATINYMDRQILGVFKTTLQHDLGWNEIDYSNLVTYFQGAYALGMLAMGRIIDRLGTRRGYSLAMIFWSVASMAHAAGRSLVTFIIARSALGFGEAGVFPASIKCVAEWFPKKERALATGIFNAGTNVGAILTPVIAPIITVWLGWRWAFFIVGALGFLWLALWLALYRKPQDHPRCSAAELAYISRDPQQETGRIAWAKLIPHRQTWAFATGKFLIDPIWWFYLFWIPDFLQRTQNLRLLQASIPLASIYLIATFGSVGGGWISSSMIKRGISVNASRKTAMLICAICVLPIMLTYRTSDLRVVVLIIGLAAAAHQGFSANLFTLTSDMFPGPAVASVTGIGGMAGAIGGMLIAKTVGYVLQSTGSYMLPFFIAGSAYMVA